jgi:hypothetical protein
MQSRDSSVDCVIATPTERNLPTAVLDTASKGHQENTADSSASSWIQLSLFEETDGPGEDGTHEHLVPA